VVAFKKLNLTLVLLSSLKSGECAQITSLAGSGILLTRIQTELTGFELSDHALSGCNPVTTRRLTVFSA
jgi:hypothetical protein